MVSVLKKARSRLCVEGNNWFCLESGKNELMGLSGRPLSCSTWGTVSPQITSPLQDPSQGFFLHTQCVVNIGQYAFFILLFFILIFLGILRLPDILPLGASHPGVVS